MSAFPSGRRRIVASATTTTASVPRLLPAIATDARQPVEVILRRRDRRSPNVPCTGIAITTPTASPVQTSPSGAGPASGARDQRADPEQWRGQQAAGEVVDAEDARVPAVRRAPRHRAAATA